MEKSSRILSIDIVRGLTLGCMIMVNNPGRWDAIYTPLEHVEWNGLTPTDLVFPFFMFIMGMSIPLSLKHYTDKGAATIRIIKRTVLLFLIGLCLTAFSGICFNSFSFSTLRILGVLHRLALVYGAGALITLYVNHRKIPYIAGIILLLYLIVMQVFDGYVHSPENFVAKIDVMILGASHMYTEVADGVRFAFDPEGLFSTIPGIAHVLLGVTASRLMTESKDSNDRCRILSLYGTALLFTGFLFQFLDPINKKLWTSTFVLVTCGSCSLLTSLIEYLVNRSVKHPWTGVFETFGSNALFIYIVSWILAAVFSIPFIGIGSETFSIESMYVNKVLDQFLNPFNSSLAYALSFVLLNWLIARVLYVNKIYIKL